MLFISVRLHHVFQITLAAARKDTPPTLKVSTKARWSFVLGYGSGTGCFHALALAAHRWMQHMPEVMFPGPGHLRGITCLELSA